VLPASALELLEKGRQNDAPLLPGSNADEGTLFANRVQPEPTPASFTDQVRTFFGSHADAILKVYPADTPEQAKASFAALLGDQLISYPSWLLHTLQAKTGKAPTYCYSFEVRPPAPSYPPNVRALSSRDKTLMTTGWRQFALNSSAALKWVWSPN